MFVNHYYNGDGCSGCLSIIGFIVVVIFLMALCQGGG